MTGTWAVMIFLAGGTSALCLRALLLSLHRELRRLGLPAATPRAIARVRRQNRLDLRHVRTAREAGVRVERTSEQLRLGPVQRFAWPAEDDFEEHTRG